MKKTPWSAVRDLISGLDDDEALRVMAEHGYPPIRGASPDAPTEETDEDEEDKEPKGKKSEEEEPDEKPKKKASKEKTDDDEDEGADLAGDEDTEEWLENIIKVPEIQSIIRRASREVAKQADKTISEARDELSETLNKELSKIDKRLQKGQIDEEEASEEAERVAKQAAKKAARDAGDDEEPKADKEPKDDPEEKKRAAKLKRRELDLYRREALATEDSSSIIPEMVELPPTDDVDEDWIDDQIEKSRAARKALRKKIISELKEQGWKSPKDKGDDTPTPRRRAPRDDDDEDRAPSSRDPRSEELTAGKRKQLRDRFGYGKDRKVPA